MKFTKFGKALLMGALSAGVALSITSCVESYSVGFLYVTGTQTSDTTGAGIISGFKIDHNTGKLSTINGLPIASGGANPVRAVLLTGSRFLYVLNRGTNASGGSVCTTANPCQNANITLFAVGANGILSQQAQYYTQGVNPFRLVADSQGNFLYVLEHDAPDNTLCSQILTGATSCGDISAFKIDSTTGRLSLIQNNVLTTSTGAQATYFPVPANPVDFSLAGGYVVTLSGPNATTFPYTGGTAAFPYSYNSSSGQLTINQTSSQSLGIHQGTGLVYTGGYLYVMDNETTTSTINGVTTTAQAGIIPYTLGTSGALQLQVGGPVADDPTLSNPTWMVTEAGGKWVYAANAGNAGSTTNAASGISGYVLVSNQLTFMAEEPFGSGNGPQCIVEDPSSQFIYTANYDGTVTGRSIDKSSGILRQLTANTSSYAVNGPASWCLTDGRTD